MAGQCLLSFIIVRTFTALDYPLAFTVLDYP